MDNPDNETSSLFADVLAEVKKEDGTKCILDLEMQRKWNNNYNERINKYQKSLSSSFTDKPIIIISLIKRSYPYYVTLNRQIDNNNVIIDLNL